MQLSADNCVDRAFRFVFHNSFIARARKTRVLRLDNYVYDYDEVYGARATERCEVANAQWVTTEFIVTVLWRPQHNVSCSLRALTCVKPFPLRLVKATSGRL